MSKFKSSHPEHQKYEDAVEAKALAVHTAATGQGDLFYLPDCIAVIWELNVTAAGTLVGDTLDVYVSTLLPGSATVVPVVHFTQVLGNGGAKRYIAKTALATAQAEFDVATALAGAGVRNIFGSAWRVSWGIAFGGGTHSFTFSVHAMPIGI